MSNDSHPYGHSHGHAHGHSHGPALARAGARHVRPLAIAFGLIAAFFVVEAVAGFVTNSLALLSDAGHMLTDVVGLGMALAAIQLASRYDRNDRAGRDGAEPSQHTFGLYRLEILAAFVNALLLFAVAVYVLVEATRRLFDEQEVLGVPMLVVATVGLVVNLIAFALLREGAKESLNVQGAYLEVLADTIGSVGVVIAAVSLELFGWGWIDPVIGAVALAVICRARIVSLPRPSHPAPIGPSAPRLSGSATTSSDSRCRRPRTPCVTLRRDGALPEPRHVAGTTPTRSRPGPLRVAASTADTALPDRARHHPSAPRCNGERSHQQSGPEGSPSPPLEARRRATAFGDMYSRALTPAADHREDLTGQAAWNTRTEARRVTASSTRARS